MKTKFNFLFMLLSINLYSSEPLHTAECLILEDENSIVCKYNSPSNQNERVVTISWINPEGIIQRKREITIAPLNSSIYDFRFLDGLESGQWQFVVLEDNKEVAKTTFTMQSKEK